MATPLSSPLHTPSAGRRAALPAVALLVSTWLVACGGGSSSSTPDLQPRNESAIATAQSGEVLSYVRRKLKTRGPLDSSSQTFGDVPEWLGTASTPSGAVVRTGTLVQEAGVDEDDLIKTDGTRIVTLQPLQHDGSRETAFARLGIHTLDAAGRAQLAGAAMINTDKPAWMATRGMLLASDVSRVALLAESAGDPLAFPDCPEGMACITALLPFRPSTPQVHVQLLDVSQPANLPPPERLVIDGQLVGTRMIGRTLYVVATHAPQFAFDRLPLTTTPAERQLALDTLTLADVLPTISVNGAAPQPLVTEGDCWLQPANTSQQVAVTTLTAIDLASPTYARSSRCFVGGTEALYMSPASIYLATTRNDVQTQQGRIAFAPEMRTDIHKFGVIGSSIAYRGSGSVSGSLGWDRERTPYRLSEHNGDLRVISFSGSLGWVTEADAASMAASPATLTVLRERTSDASLQAVATLPNAQRPAPIGKAGEQIYAVRFLGERAYVVTFRRTDPLVVLDLSNPADPRSAGELQVPGFSDWLFPIDGGLLFGVGKDANAEGQVLGAKVALFDVRDAANPRLLDSRTFGLAGSSTALDTSSHGMSLQAVGSATRMALPMMVMTGDTSLPALNLQRFEVDSAARSLVVKPAIELGQAWVDIGSWRTLQLGAQLYLLRDGRLDSLDW